MIWRAFAISASLLAAGTTQAETVVARSGEHDGFSRLVMRLPDGANWALEQSGRAASLKIDSPSVVFDTSRVFDLIPRDRLQGLSQRGTGQPLRLELGCNCEIRSYVQRDGYLVVDIRDGDGGPEQAAPARVNPVYSNLGNLPLGQPVASEPATPPAYRFNLSGSAVAGARMEMDLRTAIAAEQTARLDDRPRVQNQPEPQSETESATSAAATTRDALVAAARFAEPEPVGSRGSAVLAAGLDAELGLNKPEDVVEEEAAAEVSQEVETPEPAQTPDVNLLLNLEETARAATVNASEHRLLQQIGRAANQGLLDIVLADGSEGDGNRPLELLERSNQPQNPLDNISVTSAIDRETGQFTMMDVQGTRNDHCLPDRSISVHTWGNDSPFADQLGPLRSDLVREFDDINPASVRALAKLYLYFGFGAEARAMLEMVPADRSDPKQRETLIAMAALLDGEELEINHPFSGQQGCEGDAALWSALADGSIRKTANTDAIQQTFARLPVHLRVNFGPQLSALFAEAGDLHIAEAVLRSVSRTGMEYIPEINLAEAAIAELEGDTEVVAEKLTEEVAERTESAPTALIDLIELSYRERKALSPDVPELTASYELESRDSELGARLRSAGVVSLALTGQFEQAFDALRQVSRHDGPTAQAEVMNPLMTLLTERADDVTFLQHGLVFAGQSTATEAAPVAEIMARRLLDLGFAEQAQTILQKLALEPENETRRLMMAEAALLQGKPHNALVELMGLEGSKANQLRAQALWRNGEFGRAGEYMLAEQDENAAARGFWHSEDMDAIETMSTAGEAPFGQVATVTSQISQTSQDPEGLSPLAHARALVESSIGTRDNIEDLLNRVNTINGVPEE